MDPHQEMNLPQALGDLQQDIDVTFTDVSYSSNRVSKMSKAKNDDHRRTDPEAEVSDQELKIIKQETLINARNQLICVVE